MCRRKIRWRGSELGPARWGRFAVGRREDRRVFGVLRAREPEPLPQRLRLLCTANGTYDHSRSGIFTDHELIMSNTSATENGRPTARSTGGSRTTARRAANWIDPEACARSELCDLKRRYNLAAQQAASQRRSGTEAEANYRGSRLVLPKRNSTNPLGNSCGPRVPKRGGSPN
jgi:hypothetical protein